MKSEMKIKIYYKSKCLTLAYFRTGNNTIVSWYMPQYLSRALVSDEMTNMDFHVTYPRDGNMHYSYKYLNSTENLWYEKRVYHDEIVLKQFDEKKVFLGYKKEPRNEKHPQQILVRRHKSDPTISTSFVFDFPQSGMIINDELLDKIEDRCDNKSGNDLIFDITGFEGRTLNFGFFLYGSERKEPLMGKISSNVMLNQLTIFDGATMEGYIFIVEEKNKK